jgi:hypothetical protein
MSQPRVSHLRPTVVTNVAQSTTIYSSRLPRLDLLSEIWIGFRFACRPTCGVCVLCRISRSSQRDGFETVLTVVHSSSRQ